MKEGGVVPPDAPCRVTTTTTAAASRIGGGIFGSFSIKEFLGYCCYRRLLLPPTDMGWVAIDKVGEPAWRPLFGRWTFKATVA